MRKILIFTASLIAFIAVKAEDNNPYAKFGYTPKNEYVIANKKKLEIKNIDTSAQAFMLYFDFDTKRVCLKDKNGILLMAKDIPADVVAKWISVDPKASERAGLTPYNFVQNSPLIRIDPDGQLDFQCNDDELQANNLTSDDITRFKSVVDNLSSIVKDNKDAMNALINNTGLSSDQILKDLQANSGPKIVIGKDKYGMSGSINGIIVDPSVIKAFSSIAASNTAELALQTLCMAVSLIHEYTHYGDEYTNRVFDGYRTIGKNSGEWVMQRNGSGSYQNNQVFWASSHPDEAVLYGKQNHHYSLMPERGDAVELLGFGLNISPDIKPGYIFNTFISEKPTLGVDNPNARTFPKFPSALPLNMQGTTILQTLHVQ